MEDALPMDEDEAMLELLGDECGCGAKNGRHEQPPETNTNLDTQLKSGFNPTRSGVGRCDCIRTGIGAAK